MCFDLYLPRLTPNIFLFPQIIKELRCQSNQCSFHLSHLSFNVITKKIIGYVLSNWISTQVFLRCIVFLLHVQEPLHYLLSQTILSSPFSSSTTFRSSPKIYSPICLLYRSLRHTIQCHKYNTLPISSRLFRLSFLRGGKLLVLDLLVLKLLWPMQILS